MHFDVIIWAIIAVLKGIEVALAEWRRLKSEKEVK